MPTPSQAPLRRAPAREDLTRLGRWLSSLVAPAALLLACAAPPVAKTPETASVAPTANASPAAPPPPRTDRGRLLKHLPPDCGNPKLPCSEVGNSDDLATLDPDALAAPPAPIYPTSYRGSLESTAIAATLETEGARFRACELRGTAVVRVIVNADGSVRSAAFFREGLVAGEKDCLVRVISSLTFPAPGDAAEVIIPFVFRAKKP